MSNIIVKPFATLIGAIFLWLLNTVHNHGIALILLSVIVSVISFPFYHFAERIQQKERRIQQEMKPKIEEFKNVYEGYELYLYTKNVYRLHDYHPVYALRGLLSLLIQIPFFIGAYSFLSNYEGFAGVSFLFVSDLALPDAMLTLGTVKINLLPFLMTGINLLAGYVYAKEMTRNEKITIVVIPLFFLVILYSASSALLVYWTFNNMLNLGKNLMYRKLGNIQIIQGREA